MEHETTKLKEQDEEHTKEVKEWKSQLKPRKQVSPETVEACFLLRARFCIFDSFFFNVIYVKHDLNCF